MNALSLARCSQRLAISLLLSCSALAASDEQICNAIYRVEGGSRAKVPYGILSMPVRDAAHARRVCLNTIKNNRIRGIKAGQPGNFLDYLADRYCPRSADPIGNKNWKRNIHKLVKE